VSRGRKAARRERKEPDPDRRGEAAKAEPGDGRAGASDFAQSVPTRSDNGAVSLPVPESAASGAFRYRLPVTLSVADGPPVAGWLSLSKRPDMNERPQTLLERLNEPVSVVPVTHGDVTHLVNRTLIEWAEPGPGVEAVHIGPPANVTREEYASVWLRSGRKLDGVIAMEMPDGYNRTSDFINSQDEFFILRCRDRTLLVNKRRVRELRIVRGGGPGI
jgi:hypothetical protein